MKELQFLSQYCCDQCPYVTKQKYDLGKHIKCVHSKIKDKLLSCKVCGFTSNYPKNVKRHIENFEHKNELIISTKYRKSNNLKNELNTRVLKGKE